MKLYWLGLATLPALAVAYLLAVAIGSRILAVLIASADSTIHRIKPGAPIIQRRLRAAAIYGAPRGLVIAKGRFGLVLISGLDKEAQRWAFDRLAEPLRTIEPGPFRKAPGVE